MINGKKYNIIAIIIINMTIIALLWILTAVLSYKFLITKDSLCSFVITYLSVTKVNYTLI